MEDREKREKQAECATVDVRGKKERKRVTINNSSCWRQRGERGRESERSGAREMGGKQGCGNRTAVSASFLKVPTCYLIKFKCVLSLLDLCSPCGKK